MMTLEVLKRLLGFVVCVDGLRQGKEVFGVSGRENSNGSTSVIRRETVLLYRDCSHGELYGGYSGELGKDYFPIISRGI
jgi:hypothetical protein